MEVSLLLIRQIAELFFMLLMGFIIAKIRFLSEADSKVVSKLVLYLVMPCSILNAFQESFSKEKLRGLLLAFAAALLAHLLLMAVNAACQRLLHMDGVEVCSAYYSNAANLIIPVVGYVLGGEWVLYSCAYITVQTAFIWTHGKRIMSGEKGFGWKKVFTNINLLVTAAGIVMFLGQLRMPALLRETVASVGQMVGPLSMIVTGILVGYMPLKEVFATRRVYLVSALRLLLYPLLFLAVLKCSGMAAFTPDGDTILLVSFLATTAPSAAAIVQMAQVYGGDSAYASKINVMTTLLCILTMPLMVMLYQAW